MTPKPVFKTIGGVAFADPYAHLHDDTPDALAWQWEQDERARKAAINSSNFPAVRDRLLELDPGERFQFAPCRAGGKWFSTGARNGEGALLVQDDLSDCAHVIDTVGAIADRDGASVATLIGMAPSPRGTYVAAAFMLDGNTVGPWGVYDVPTRQRLFTTPPAPHIHAQPGWLPDESGFWLAGHTAEGLHRLRFYPVAPDAPQHPDVVIPPELAGAKHPGLTTQVSPDGRRAVLVTEMHEHIAAVLLDLSTFAMRRFMPDGWTGECDGAWAGNDTYVARVHGDAPRGRVVAIPVDTSSDPATWRQIVAEGDGFLNWAGVVGGRVYVGDMLDVSQRIRIFDLDGSAGETLPLPSPCAVPSMVISRAIRPTEAFAFTHTTLTQSPALMLHDPRTNVLDQVRAPVIELPGIAVERHFATSRDGTKIPYFLVRRAGAGLNGTQPCLVHAYGGFNVSLLPEFPANFVPFIEAGGIFVQASLRGGGEFGQAWHDGGRLTNKQNTFDDLAAVANAIIEQGISTPAQMAFQGMSNGGMLAGIAIVQQPHLWRAVAPVVPLFDMMETFPIVPETAVMRAVFYDDYGDVADPEEARTIFSWSPYHNIRSGLAYPAVYQVFGENDPACRPFHGRKFTARLRDADTGGRPLHLRVWRNTGHGPVDPAQAAAYSAEWLSFLMDQVGLTHPDAQEPEISR